jgi:hypothetical protein
MPQQAKAATIASWTLVVPAEGNGNEYLVIVNRGTGDIVDPNVVNNATGIPESDTTWTEGAIAVTAHTESAWLTFTVPALADGYEYAAAIYSNATPANSDTPINDWTFLIDPLRQVTYGDANPNWKGQVTTWDSKR